MFELPHPTASLAPAASPARSTNGAAEAPAGGSPGPGRSGLRPDARSSHGGSGSGDPPGERSPRMLPLLLLLPALPMNRPPRRRAMTRCDPDALAAGCPPSLRRSKLNLVYDMVWGNHNCLMISDPVRDNFEVILTSELKQAAVDPDTFLCCAGERHGIFRIALLLERGFVEFGTPTRVSASRDEMFSKHVECISDVGCTV